MARTLSQNDLRRTALQVSKEAGTHIRTRRHEPLKHFLSISALARMVLRAARDLEGRMAEENAAQALGSRSESERSDVLKDLLQADAVIESCVGRLRKLKTDR
ncbi:hypothetical protein KW785_03430 [Candidatus Parcubacteria bacterium]|nr:hypothetical protein [Candidatus Parcubacteria bacterium]